MKNSNPNFTSKSTLKNPKLLNFCETYAKNEGKYSLRADTHSKNIPMNSLFKKLNFEFCGAFHIPCYEDEFFAYEKILNQKAF